MFNRKSRALTIKLIVLIVTGLILIATSSHVWAEFKYGDQWLAKQVGENRYDNKFKILSRAIKEKPYYQFYDNLSLGKTLDDLIRYNSTRF